MSAFVRRAPPRCSFPHPRPGARARGLALALALAVLPTAAACRAPEATRPRVHEEPDAPEAPTAEEAPAVAAAPEQAPAGVAAAEPAPAAAPAPEPEPEPAPAPGTLTPLTEAQIAILFSSEQDDVPEYREGITPKQENFHYLSGNERTLDAYYPLLQEDVGGAYVGVGTDQAYFFMSWARFEIAWLIDYDPAVQQVHELYRLFFTAAATPSELVALWDEPGREAAFALIDAAHDEARAKQLRYWYKASRARIHRRLVNVGRRLQRVGVPSFLGDQAHYDYVRLMLEQRRVRPLLVNLLDEDGLVALGRASEQLGVPIRVLYLSNAEQYWKRYSPQYRRNIASLPFSDDGVVLRTLLSQAINDDYRYHVQPAANYQEWLSRPFVGNVYQIVRGGPEATPEGITLFRTDADPDQSAAGRRYREKHGG